MVQQVELSPVVMRTLLRHARAGGASLFSSSALRLFGHLVLLVALSRVAFGWNRGFLLYSLDGHFMRVVAQNQGALGDRFSPTLDMNFLQALGNVWYPFKAGYIPAYLTSLSTRGRIDPLLCYPIFVAELFLSTYALARSWRSSNTTGLLGGWIIVLATMPLSGPPFSYPLFTIVPQLATLIAAGSLIVALANVIGRFGVVISAASALGIFLLTIWAIVASPAGFIIIVPFVTIFGAAAIASERGLEFIVKICALGACVAALILGGPARFLAGLFEDTAAAFWPADDVTPLSRFETSSLLNAYFGWTGPYLVALGLLGAITMATQGRGPARWNGVALIASIAAIAAWGTLWLHGYLSWTGPRPVYLEISLWPAVAIYAAAMLKRLLDIGATFLARARGAPVAASNERAVLACLAVLWAFVLAVPHSSSADPFPSRPSETELTRLLAQEISISPGAPFRGRVASIAGYRGGDQDSWVEQATFDAHLVVATGNDHRLTGLPYFRIPILTEYGSFRTPGYTAIAGRLLSVPKASRRRGIAVITRANVPVMSALGVRFLLTSAPIGEPAKLRRRLDFGQSESLYLYEFPDPNLGQYSPIHALVVNSATEALKAMSSDALDLRREVVVAEPLPYPLESAKRVHMTVRRGGLRVQAESQGESVLLLPIEFSRCLQLTPPASATLFRANVMQAGLLFSGRLDAVIELSFGPLHRAGCRLEDVAEAKRFGLQDVRFEVP